MSSLFENFSPNIRVQIDYAEKGNENFLVICYQMSGFGQVYKTRNKSTEQALLKLREWGANFGFPLVLLADSCQKKVDRRD